eukprot:FR740109.1.p2 GENE.FR740109.1~~FR740109.1.p2  ORF type:complete len:119 (-),score=62.36 FR740109.1:688-1044(-)
MDSYVFPSSIGPPPSGLSPFFIFSGFCRVWGGKVGEGKYIISTPREKDYGPRGFAREGPIYPLQKRETKRGGLPPGRGRPQQRKKVDPPGVLGPLLYFSGRPFFFFFFFFFFLGGVLV